MLTILTLGLTMSVAPTTLPLSLTISVAPTALNPKPHHVGGARVPEGDGAHLQRPATRGGRVTHTADDGGGAIHQLQESPRGDEDLARARSRCGGGGVGGEGVVVRVCVVQ